MREKNNLSKMRNEKKYLINYTDYLVLRQCIGRLLIKDENMKNAEDYTVSSLYFDDIENTALYEKTFGVQNRDKYRIRIYNGSDETIRLEKKSKYNSHTNKESTILTKEDYYSIICENKIEIKKESSPLLTEFYSSMHKDILRPKIIVEYDREAYVGKVSNLRITFDKNLRYFFNSLNLFGENNAALRVLEDNLIILEVKYDSILPEYIRSIISSVDKQTLAVSKYMLCRENISMMKGFW